MNPKSQRPKDREGAISALDTAIEDLNLAQKVSSITPAKGGFGTVGILLADIRVYSLLINDDLPRVHT